LPFPTRRSSDLVSCGIHRCEVRVGNDHLVADALEVPRGPLALGAGFEQDACTRQRPEHCSESIAARHDPALLDSAVFVCNAELALAFVKIEPYRNHGWPPGTCVPRSRTVST